MKHIQDDSLCNFKKIESIINAALNLNLINTIAYKKN